MKNSRELIGDVSLVTNFGMTLERYQEIAENTNVKLDSIDTCVTDAAFVLGIEEVLKEIASLKIIELEDTRGTIESNSTYNEAWEKLLNLNEEIYDLLGYNQEKVAQENFILGFVEGYKMMKLIAENGE